MHKIWIIIPNCLPVEAKVTLILIQNILRMLIYFEKKILKLLLMIIMLK